MARKVLAEFDAIDGPFNAKVRLIEQGVARFEKGTLAGFSRVEKGLDSLLGYAARLRNVSYLVAGGLGASQFTQFIDTSIRIRNELRGIGEDSNANFQKVYLAATRSLAPIDAFTSAVLRTQKVMGDKQSFDQTVRQVETLTKLLAVSGKSEAERASTLLQFTQALQAGALQGDEMRALRENAPVEFLRAIAKAAGGTLADLKKFSQEGVITTEVMIRALDSLAATADARIGKVTLTIGDAVNVLRNGAIVAAEAFNGGSGLSSAVVGTLSEVGNILGQSAGAARMFGEAVKVAGVLFAGAFAGRKISDATSWLSAFLREAKTGESARQNLLALRNDVVLAQTAVSNATDTLAKKKAALALAEAKGTTSAASLAKAQAGVLAAEKALIIQREVLITATNAAAVAQERLSFAARAGAAAANVAKAAWAFMGGWPGLLLIAGTAFYALKSSAEAAFGEAAQGISDNQTAVSELKDEYRAAADQITQDLRSLEQAHKDVADAVRSGDTEVQLAAQGEITALDARIAKNRELLQTYTALMAAKLQESKDALATLNATEARDAGAAIGKTAVVGGKFYAKGAPVPANDAEVKSYVDGLQKKIMAGQKLDAAETEFLNHHLTLVQARQQVDDQAAALTQALVATQEGMIALVDRSASGVQAEISGLAQSFAAIGNTDVAGQMMSLADAMASYQADFEAGRITADEFLTLTQSLKDQTDLYVQSLNGVDAMRFDGLMGQFSTMLDWLNKLTIQAWDFASIPALRGPAGMGAPPADPISENPGKPKKGGGGGQTQAEKDQKAALDFIKEMMTAEEQRAAKLTELLALRQRLVESYGPEAQAVADLDAAIQRYRDSADEAAQAQQQLFDDLSNQLANAITDWTNFGDVVRHILASLVQSYGPDFFTALLTPGKQTGDSTGTWLGNMLTGQNHSGGGFGTQNARSISPMAFMGAPRFHNGLMPDEFTAILQKGETVLPKGFSPAGGGVSINMPIDMRGADPSMRPFIEGQIAQLKKELPGRVVSAVKSAQKSRSL